MSPGKRLLFVCFFSVACSQTGCRYTSTAPTEGQEDSSPAQSVLRLATTTSTRDSGLLDTLLPRFEREHHCRVDVIAVGTGAALKLGEAGDVDVVLVHAPKAEQDFVDAGHGTRREEFMYNYFTVLGPPSDPAGIRDKDPAAAFKQIAQGQHRFLSRGDDSGTHKRELALWTEAGGRPKWDGYIEGGQGMGATLIMTDEMRGYTLSDQATYLKFQEKMDLVPLVVSSRELKNTYSGICVNPVKHKKINAKLAGALLDFLISPYAQRLIKDYKVSNQPLFFPTRLPAENQASARPFSTSSNRH